MMPVIDTIRLFHGTTLAAARRIESEGFDPVSPLSLIEGVSARHRVPVGEVVRRLEAGARYATYDARPDWVSFSPTFDAAAASWAQRAPEAKWEALGAVYEHLHDLDSAREPWWSTDSGNWWVQREMLDGAPAVVEIKTDIANCWQTHFSGEPWRPITEMLAIDREPPKSASAGPIADHDEEFISTMPELKVRADAPVRIVGVIEVERLISPRMALYLHEALDEFGDWVDRAALVERLGEPPTAFRGESLWPLTSILRGLPSDRLAELGFDATRLAMVLDPPGGSVE